MLNETQTRDLGSHCRTKVVSLLDPSVVTALDNSLRASLNMTHKGFYVGVVDAEGKELARAGFLRASPNIADSVDIVAAQMAEQLRAAGVSLSKVQTSTFFLTLVTDVTYIQDPTHWQEESDGIYFMWGQSYRGLYLPYQIKRMGASKVEVLDRLCTWEAGVASNLWRLPEGLVWRLTCQSFSA